SASPRPRRAEPDDPWRRLRPDLDSGKGRTMTTLAGRAKDFLAQGRIALVGVSRDPRDLSRTLFRELRQRGYDVVPVHPTLESVDGVPFARGLQDVSPPADGALLMTPPGAADPGGGD